MGANAARIVVHSTALALCDRHLWSTSKPLEAACILSLVRKLASRLLNEEQARCRAYSALLGARVTAQ